MRASPKSTGSSSGLYGRMAAFRYGTSRAYRALARPAGSPDLERGQSSAVSSPGSPLTIGGST
jgi:hypothetical protein